MVFYILFIIAAFYNLDIDQMDVKMIFLYKKINQFFFIEMPKDYYNNFENIVYKLNKVLYDLKQFL